MMSITLSGGGHHERYYQRALSEALLAKKLAFKEQVYAPLRFNGKIIGKNFFDFLVENKIIIEIKKGNRFSTKHINQVLEYLKTSNLKLAILINFGQYEVSSTRVLNSDL